MFGINGSEFIILMIVVVVVIGPERMPEYAAKLARLVRQLREWLTLLRRSCASRWARSSMTSTGNSTTFVSTTLGASFARLSWTRAPTMANHLHLVTCKRAASKPPHPSSAMTRESPHRMTRKPPRPLPSAYRRLRTWRTALRCRLGYWFAVRPLRGVL